VRRGKLRLALLRPGGDPGAADADAVVAGGHGGHGADCLGYRPSTRSATRGSGTSFRDVLTWAAAVGGGRPGNGRIRDDKPARHPARHSPLTLVTLTPAAAPRYLVRCRAPGVFCAAARISQHEIPPRA